MKSFQQFIIETELRDKEGLGGGTGMSHRGGEKIGSERKKTAAERRRSGKAIGGGKTAPTQDYKPRKDIGKQRSKSEREQQPTRERGTAALSPREQQRKAAKERRAAKKGAKTKTASQLLSTKPKSKYYVSKSETSPDYKPSTGVAPSSGTSKKAYTTKERKALTKKGERTLRDLRLKNLGKKSEKELKHKVTSK